MQEWECRNASGNEMHIFTNTMPSNLILDVDFGTAILCTPCL